MQEKFIVGKYYSLKPEYVRDFDWSFDMAKISAEQGKPFTIHVKKVDENDMVIDNDTRVAKQSERHMFKEMKVNQKPFKVGQMYSLRHECVNVFAFSTNIREYLTDNTRKPFTFTVDSTQNDGRIALANVNGRSFLVALGDERYMFKRVK